MLNGSGRQVLAKIQIGPGRLLSCLGRARVCLRAIPMTAVEDLYQRSLSKEHAVS